MTTEAGSLSLQSYDSADVPLSVAVIWLQCRQPSRTLAKIERLEAGQQLGRRLPLATCSNPMACRTTISEAQQPQLCQAGRASFG
jgi:hypothetical protein